LAVFGPLDGSNNVEVFDSKIRGDFFKDTTSVSIVIPFGRMFVEVVTRAVELMNRRLAKKSEQWPGEEADSEGDAPPEEAETKKFLDRLKADISLLETAAAKNRNPATAGPPIDKPWIRR
jgi:hypothetical protein